MDRLKLSMSVCIHIFNVDDTENGSPVMHCCGVLDVEGTTVSAQHKFNQVLHGIYLPHTTSQHSSLPTHFPSHLYLHGTHIEDCADDLTRIPYGDAGFANDYEWDYILKAFPKEFPFGSGGFSCPDREGKAISWEEHMRWMMEQSHGKFAAHEVFMFVVFNILQRRKICLGAKLVTRRNNLPKVATLLRNLDYEKVNESITRDIETGTSISSPLRPSVS